MSEMTFDTYSDLRNAIASMLNREGDQDTLDAAAGFIKLAEARIRRVLSSKNIILKADVAITAPTPTAALPTDVLRLRSVSLNSFGQLEPTSYAELQDGLTQWNVAGTPRRYAVLNDILYFAPVPDQNYTATIVYEPELPALKTASANWLLTRYPDIYFYGALIHAAPFLRDDSRVSTFEPIFTAGIMELEILRDRTNYPSTPVMRPRRVF